MCIRRARRAPAVIASGWCAGLRAFCGAEPEAAPDYAPDWAEAGEERLLNAARRWLVARNSIEPGDVLLFRMAEDAAVRHAAIVTGPSRIVHAYWGRAVVESRLAPFWRSRLAAAFSFPGVE